MIRVCPYAKKFEIRLKMLIQNSDLSRILLHDISLIISSKLISKHSSYLVHPQG